MMEQAAHGRSRASGPTRRDVATGALAMAAAALGGARPGLAVETDRKLVALGDSLTAGYGLPAASAFPTVLEAALRGRGRNVAVANAGVSGDTSTGGLERVEWSVADGTDGVIVELGANDMLRGVDPAVTRRALDGIITRLQARKIPVMLAGMRAVPNYGADYVTRFEAIYPDLARQYGLVLYPFFLDGVATKTQLTQPDGLHPTAAGIHVIVERILPSVVTFLDRIGSPPG